MNPTPTGPASMTTPRNVVSAEAKAAQAPATPVEAPVAAEAPVIAELQPIGWYGEVELSQIEISDIALRPAQTESAEYQNLKASIDDIGMQQNITITPSATTPGKYTLVNGLQRTTIAMELGWDKIRVLVVDADEAKMHSHQIQSNLHFVKTNPAQFGASIRRMMELNPNLSVVDLATELNVSTGYIMDRINLKHLLPEIHKKVDEGEINASAAFKLAKLPAEEQTNFVARAVSMKIDEFTDQVEARLADINKAKREGRVAGEEKFEAQSSLRKKAEISDEAAKHIARAQLVTEGMSAPAAFDLAIAWVLQLDPASVEAQREAWDAAKKARDERAAARAKAQEDKKKEKGAKAEDAAAAAIASA